MTTVLPEQDTTWITDELLEKSIPCDYHQFRCHMGGPAKWRAQLVPCPDCGRRGGARVICEDCKNYILLTTDAAQCNMCDFVSVPFRDVFQSIAAL